MGLGGHRINGINERKAKSYVQTAAGCGGFKGGWNHRVFLRTDTSTSHTCVDGWERLIVHGESETNIPFIFEAGCNGEANDHLRETTYFASELSSDLGSSSFLEVSAVRRVLRGSRERGVKDSKCGQDFQTHGIMVEFFRSLTARAMMSGNGSVCTGDGRTVSGKEKAGDARCK